jgi:hypothetical protein
LGKGGAKVSAKAKDLLREIVEFIQEHPEWAEEYFFEEPEDSWERNWFKRAVECLQ